MARTLAVVVALVPLSACMDYDFTAVDIDPSEVTECGFTQSEEVEELWVYDCNPVFDLTDEGWLDSVGSVAFSHREVLGHPFYQAWYVGFSDAAGDYSLGYAVSDEGTLWETHPDNPSWPVQGAGGWNAGKIQAQQIAWNPDSGGYAMVYNGIDEDRVVWAWGMASSPDGHGWTQAPSNPLVDMGAAYGGVEYSWPLSLEFQDQAMVLHAAGQDLSDEEADSHRNDVYRLVEADPNHWQMDGELVFRGGDDGDWDDLGAHSMANVEFEGRRLMFYGGYGSYVANMDNSWTVDESYLGLAYSDDGGHSYRRMFEDPLPVHVSEGNVGSVSARRVGTRIHLWVEDYYQSLGGNAIGYFLYQP